MQQRPPAPPLRCRDDLPQAAAGGSTGQPQAGGAPVYRGQAAGTAAATQEDPGGGPPAPWYGPQAPNEVWSADFVFDRTADGRVVKCLTVVDDATTEAVAIVPARTLGGLPVTRVLDRLAFERGLPRVLRTACYEQVVKALGAVGPSNRGTDTGSGSVEPAHRASSGLIPEERRVPGGSTSSCLRREELRTTVGMASSPVGAGASGFYAAIDSSLHTWSASNAVRFLTTANA